MTARRQLNSVAAVAAVTAAASATLLFVAGRPWLTLHAQRPAPFAGISRQVLGRQDFPALSGLAVVGLLAAALALFSGRWVRRGLGVLLAGAGGLVLSYAVNGLGHPSPGRRDELLTGNSAGTSGHGPVSVQRHLVWPLASVPVAVCFLLAGLVMVICAGRWAAGLSAKYDAPTRQSPGADPWREMDRGVDPTTTDR